MYLVCSVLGLSLHQNTAIQRTLHKSLHCSPEVIPISHHSISNRTRLMGFVSKSADCFSSLNLFYPNVIIKVSFLHIEVSHLNVSRPLWYFGFSVSLMALALSMYSIGVFLTKSNYNSVCRHFTYCNDHGISCRDGLSFADDFQNTAPSANIAITPMVERLVALPPARSPWLKYLIRQNL